MKSRCKYANGADFLHCTRCGAPLDAATVMRSEEESGTLKEAMFEMLKA